MGGLPCAKVIIDQMVAAMATASLTVLDGEYLEPEVAEKLRERLLKTDLIYLRDCIKAYQDAGVVLPIQVSTLLLEKIMEVPGEPTG